MVATSLVATNIKQDKDAAWFLRLPFFSLNIACENVVDDIMIADK